VRYDIRLLANTMQHFGVAVDRYCRQAPFKRVMKESQMAKTGKMTVQAASRIYSATATKGDGSVGKNTFAAKAMRVATRPTGPSPAQLGGKVGTSGYKL
jgi:hypothetical protein